MEKFSMHPLFSEIKKLSNESDKIKILYVDDDEIIRHQIKKVFSEFFGDRVIFAENGKEALELFKKERPQILITDINMPIMNGFKLIDKIKKEISLVEYYHLSIAIVTSFEDPLYLQKAIEENVDGYVLKPLKFDLLLELIYKLLIKATNIQDTLEHNSKLESKNIENQIIIEKLQDKIIELEKEQRYSKMKNLFIAKDRVKEPIEQKSDVNWFKPTNREKKEILDLKDLIVLDDNLDYLVDILSELDALILSNKNIEELLLFYSENIEKFIDIFTQNTLSQELIENLKNEIVPFCRHLKERDTALSLKTKDKSILISYLEMIPRELQKWLDAIKQNGIYSKDEIVRTDILIITIKQFEEFVKEEQESDLDSIFF